MLSDRAKFSDDHRYIVWIILIVGLVHGLIYVFFVPWWEHYDEPGHFEYAWLAANKPTWPMVGEFNQEMRLKLDATIQESGFFNHRQTAMPNLTDPSKDLWVGYSQVGDSPFYYFLASLPLRLLKDAPIPTQLYAGRLVSLLFYLLTIWAAIQFAAELTPARSPIRWLLPLFLALLPGFTEFMTALNNHTAAIGLGSVWIWLAVRLIRRGPRWMDILFLSLATVLCYITQQIVWITIPLFPLVLALTFIRRNRWIVAIGLAAVFISSLLLIFSFNDAAYWIRRNYQDFPTRTAQSTVPFAKNAIQLKLYPDQDWGIADTTWQAGIYQLVPFNFDTNLRGKVVTLGAWVWADHPVTVYGPGINVRKNNQDIWFGFGPLEAGEQPKFTAFHVKIPKKGRQVQLWLRATSPSDLPLPTNVYFSGIVLAEGIRPVKEPPQFSSPDGSQGSWGGQTFSNMARNAFAADKWPNLSRLVTSVQEVTFFDVNPSSLPTTLSLVLDYPGTSWYTRSTSANLLRSFWAKFAWGQVKLIPIAGVLAHPYRLLTLLTFLAGLGFAFFLIKNWKTLPWTEVLFLLLYTGMVFLIAFVYGTLTMGGSFRYEPRIPEARYIYPAILPIGYFLLSGWLFFIQLIPPRWKLLSRLPYALIVLFLVLLDIYAIYSQIQFYSLG